MKTVARILLTGIFIFSLGSEALAKKAPECEKDGKKYGVVRGNFREEWYSYQERGESYLEGECYEAALSDFERAIELRTPLDRAAEIPGCDQRRARSYGMHFLDWFGHRGRGIALYQLGRTDEALKELELSLQCTESSQAQYYLDKARAQRLKASGEDTKDPSIASVRILLEEPRIDFMREGSPAPAAGYDRFVAKPYYFTLDEINSIKENLDNKQKKDKQYVKSLKPGWGHQVISWKSTDEADKGPVKAGLFFVLVESTDDQGVKYVEASQIRSPYVFAQKERADVFPVSTAVTLTQDQGVDPMSLAPRDLFAVDFDRSEGEVSLTVTVIDLLGKTSKKKFTIAIDREGPQLSIEEARVLPGNKAYIRGFIEEASGFKSFTIGGVTPKRVGSDRFEVTAPINKDQVSFEAVDTAGNRTTGVLVLGPATRGTMITPPTRWTRIINRIFRIAALDAFDAPTYSLPPRPGRLDAWTPEVPGLPAWIPLPAPAVRVAVELELYWNTLQEELGMTQKPPQIFIKTKPQTVYSNQIFLEGSAVGQGSAIAELLIDGKNVLRSARTNAFFNKLVYLKTGDNVIKIKAVDQQGLAAEETLTINRIVPRVQTVAERLAVSMLPFYQDPDFVDIGEVAYDNLATAFIQQRRFQYVDKSKIDAAVREMSLAGTGLSDPTTAVRAGKMTSAEAIIIGVVRETPTSVEVKAQVVDVDSSRIMVTRDAFHQDKSLENLRFITRGLAVKVQNAFPVVQGSIAQAGGGTVVVDLGRRNRVMPGMKVVFFKVIPKTDPSGQSLGADSQKLAEGTISSISSSSSNIELDKVESDPQPNDLVITK